MLNVSYAMATISIIVPFYNSAQYIKRCVESICNQTVSRELELVFVDDASTDNTRSIIEKVLDANAFHGDIQFVTHTKNTGVAIARIDGIKAASGEYILFCDSDDYQEPDICESLLNCARGGNHDMVVCDYQSRYEGSDNVSVYNNCYRLDFLRELLLCHCTGSLCNKLFRKSLIGEDFVLPEKSFCEDYVYSIQFAIKARSIGYVPRPLYNYCHRPGSIVMSFSTDKIENRFYENIDNIKLVIDILGRNNLIAEYREEIIKMKLTAKNSIRDYVGNKKFYRLWKNAFPELRTEIHQSRYVSFNNRITFYLTQLRMYPIFYKVISRFA